MQKMQIGDPSIGGLRPHYHCEAHAHLHSVTNSTLSTFFLGIPKHQLEFWKHLGTGRAGFCWSLVAELDEAGWFWKSTNKCGAVPRGPIFCKIRTRACPCAITPSSSHHLSHEKKTCSKK